MHERLAGESKLVCANEVIRLLPFPIQITYQTVLSTDGNASFAMFVYDDPGNVVSIGSNWQVGFDAGDEIRGVIVQNGEIEGDLEEVNIFRIDGKLLHDIGSGIC